MNSMMDTTRKGRLGYVTASEYEAHTNSGEPTHYWVFHKCIAHPKGSGYGTVTTYRCSVCKKEQEIDDQTNRKLWR